MTSMFWGGLWCVVALLLAVSATRTIRTKYGEISGVMVTPDSRHLGAVEVFKGVPYASPPTGSLRFMPPVTGAIWTGVKVADKFGPVCPQLLPDIGNETAALRRMPRGRLEYLKRLLPYLKNQSEDCLYLNIYAPAGGSRENRRYPVLVYVHGESYQWSTGNVFDGTVLASYGGLVVVTINYRLGILGFLNANTDPYLRSPSNYGLMDQIAALHWLQENIVYFGGDPGNVTLMGQGTGAACVHFLMTSSAVPEGVLFHRAIMMSGSANAPWSLTRQPWKYARQLARHANCSWDQSHAHLLKCLRERPLDLLMSTQVESSPFSTTFGPSVDGVVIDTPLERQTNLIGGANGGKWSNSRTREPGQGHEWGSSRKSLVTKLSRYDLLLGVVKAEAFLAFTGDDVQYGIEPDRRTNILRTFVKSTYRYHLSEILATIVNEYTDWERPVQHPINIRDETLEALSDAQYVAPIVHTADLHSSARRNSFLYVFDYQTKFGDYQQRQGCVHGEELAYVFGAPLVGGISHFTKNYTKAEVLLSEATMIYWSNFARTGNPNEPQVADMTHVLRQERSRFKNIEWTPYEAVHKKYLSLDTKPKLKNHYRAHRLSFWLNLVPDLHKPGGDDVPSAHHQLHDETKNQGHGPTSKRPAEPTSSVTFEVYASSIPEHNSSIVQPPLVVVAPSSSDRSNHDQQEDGFTAYSTALSATIAIGCSLLLLNALVFAGVYYRRDKRHGHNHNHDNIQSTAKKRTENGGPMANICVTGGATELLQIMETRNTVMPAPILKQSCETVALGAREALVQGSSTLPRQLPNPKTPRPPSAPPESQPLLPHTATLGRKPKQPMPDELRV
ncbi:neuroligin-4, Y-linked-like [Cimex lectularius]|uniref:Carboxylesterase type B domain-containing protein n=1 Tax=Cimex lectularius TaxID=79782 RepID=A0A8I6SHH1_CIMLE|nr:neuroligin-4, Y-linked-like [Cimex lectularius]XP_024081738.1 neuroligin-4, Y-linked-like [Cimex lectularius]